MEGLGTLDQKSGSVLSAGLVDPPAGAWKAAVPRAV